MTNQRFIFPACLKHPPIYYDFIFIILTALMLWVPIRFRGTFPLLKFEPIAIFALVLLLTICFFLNQKNTERKPNLLSYGFLLYGIWIVISLGMHYWAIDSLELDQMLSSNIKDIRTDKHWLMWTLVHYGVIHLQFLSLFLVSIVIFRSTGNQCNKLTWIPLIFIPCLFVALYQFYIDADFLNNRPSSHLDFDHMGGLGTDLTAFRSSLFLVFPLCVMAVIIARVWWKKVVYILLAVIIIVLSWLSYGRSAIAAILFFVIVFPAIGAWVHGFYSKKGRLYVYAGFIWILTLAMLSGFAVSSFKSSIQESPSERVKATFNKVFTRNFAEIDHFRTDRIRHSLRLVNLSPIAGWGPGGFLRNIDKIRFVYRDPLITEDPLSRHHYQYGPNLYLEWSNDFGLLGAGIILFLCVMPLWMILRVRKRIQIWEERWAVGIIAATLVIAFFFFNMAPYTHFPETQWIFVVYLGLLISIALEHGYFIYPVKGLVWSIGGLLMTTAFVAGVYGTSFGSSGYRDIYEETLFQTTGRLERHVEKKTDAVKTAVNKLKATSNIFSINVSSKAKNNLLVNGVKLKIFVNDELVDVRYFFKSSTDTLCYYIPSMKDRDVEIKTEIHPVFNLYRSSNAHIPVMVSPPSFIETLPEDGIGFHPRAKSLIGKRFNPGSPAEPVIVDARWTGMQATLNVTELMRNKGFLYLQSSNPCQERRPVCVDIIGEQGGMKRVWFWNGHWKKIYLPLDQLKKTKTLTFRVNQTWNPSLVEVSDDSRDLGIVVALPEFDEGRHFLFEHISPSSGEV